MKKLSILILATLVFTACTGQTSDETAENVADNNIAKNNLVDNKEVVTTKTFTLDEVGRHNTPDDCWLIIDEKVYDVSDYGTDHPGGDTVYEGCGKDATTKFETSPPHSRYARSLLNDFYIGDLSN